MTDIATQAKQLLNHKVVPRRRAAPRVCPLLALGHHKLVGTEGHLIATWRLEGSELDSPTALLIHGFEDDTTVWTPLVDILQAQGQAVVAFDLPGHGFSQGDSCTLEEAVTAISAVIDAHGPVDCVATHSFGGVALAQALIAGLDIKAAVLIAPPVYQGKQYAMAWRRHGVNEALIEAALALGEAEGGFFDLEQSAVNFKANALIIHSLDDPYCPAEDASKAAAAWPHAQFYAVDGLGHRDLVKDDDVVAITAAFLCR